MMCKVKQNIYKSFKNKAILGDFKRNE